MARNRDEEELLGASGDVNDGVWIQSNGASTQIEDFDEFPPVDADEDPYMPGVVDNDGVPGFRPFSEASSDFYDESLMSTRSRGTDGAEEKLGDEFVEQLKLREDAAVGSDSSDLLMLSRKGAIENQQLRGRADFARINPVSAPAAMLGNTVDLTTDDDPKQLAIWSAESPIETTPVTVTFVIPVRNDMFESPAVPPATIPLRLVGKINFGTRVRYEAEVDVLSGTQLTLNASEVTIAVGNDQSIANLRFLHPTAVASKATVGGMLSWFPCVRTAPLLRTRYIDDLTTMHATLPLLAVPNFAKRFVVHRTPVTSGITVKVYGSATNFHSDVVLEFSLAGGTIMTEPVDLPGDAVFVEVTNTSGATIQGRVIFELGL